jgi:hypothetical protein
MRVAVSEFVDFSDDNFDLFSGHTVKLFVLPFLLLDVALDSGDQSFNFADFSDIFKHFNDLRHDNDSFEDFFLEVRNLHKLLAGLLDLHEFFCLARNFNGLFTNVWHLIFYYCVFLKRYQNFFAFDLCFDLADSFFFGDQSVPVTVLRVDDLLVGVGWDYTIFADLDDLVLGVNPVDDFVDFYNFFRDDRHHLECFDGVGDLSAD